MIPKTEKSDPARPHSFVGALFRFFTWLDDVRLEHATGTKWTFGLLSGVSGAVLFWYLGPPQTLIWIGIRSVVGAALAAFFSDLFLRGLVPTLRYAPQSIAMRSLGMHLVSAGGQTYEKLVARYLKRHAKNERIRIICISGKHLFFSSETPNRVPSPLRNEAKQGTLDVLMPESDPKNSTIASRFETYSDDFKRDMSYNSANDLIDEIEESKKFLRENKKNTVTEHSMLCMWRVVILSDFCIVQSYFPNDHGRYSFLAPIFVFEKRYGVDGAFYSTFESMFELVKKHGKRKVQKTSAETP